MNARRKAVIGVSAAAIVAALAYGAERYRKHRAREAERALGPPQRPPGVPVGRFDGGSSAAEVTDGLDLSGRTVVITGATSGIGLETMRVLALRGAHVIGTGRTLEKAQAACATIQGEVTPLALELTDRAGVVECAGRVKDIAPVIDVLICNAGVMALQRLEKVDGVEKQFATNHLGHFLLAAHLQQAIRAAPQGRVVVLTSGVLTWSSREGIEWDNLSGARDYDPNRMYGQSKLANALFSLELARRLRGSAATSNAVHPGYIETSLFRHYPPSLRGFRRLFFSSKGNPIPQGAATSCYVATAPELAAVSGHYFTGCKPLIPDPRATDEAAAAKLWEVSEALLRPYLPASLPA